jgi:hypothetical protein
MVRTAARLIIAVTAAFWCTQELRAQHGGFGGGGMGMGAGGGGMGMGGGGGGMGMGAGAGMGMGGAGGAVSSDSGFAAPSYPFTSSGWGFSSASTRSNGSFSSSGLSSVFREAGFGGGSGSSTTGASRRGLRAADASTTTAGMGNHQSSQSYRPTAGRSEAASSRRLRGSNRQQTENQAGAAQQVWFSRVEVGFPVSLPPNTAVAGTLASSFHSPVLASRFSGVQVKVEGSTAVLRGTVASVGDRELAAQMALLEPSIYSIRNELTVGPPTATAMLPAQ